MNADLGNLFIRHTVVAFDKQLHLADSVGELAWHFDIAGLLSFGNLHRWRVQILGTEDEVSQNWLWGWANEASGIPPPLLGSALTLRMLGEAHGIPELAEPELPLGEINGRTLAMIGGGICRADAYCRCPYDGGALYVLI